MSHLLDRKKFVENVMLRRVENNNNKSQHIIQVTTFPECKFRLQSDRGNSIRKAYLVSTINKSKQLYSLVEINPDRPLM